MSSNQIVRAALWACVYVGLGLLAPPPVLTISQWANKHVVLSREESAEPGPWRTERAPYLREVMDCLNDPNIETAVYQLASQLGKTACMMNIATYYAHNDPCAVLFVMPTEKQVEALSKERFTPRIEASPELKKIFSAAKSRGSANTTLNKSFPGGYIAFVGANVPRDLASRSCRIVISDEVDGMLASVGVEGDPIVLMSARATNFWNRRKVFGSTPTNKGASRIEALEKQGDQRRFYVPCPQCGAMQVLEFENLHWPGKDTPGKQFVEQCYYVCVEGGCEILESDKPAMMALGAWRKTNLNPADPKCASFQLSTMYSPWFKWREMAQEFVKAGKNEKLLKVFTNTRLGRTFETKGESVDDKALIHRRITYPARVPSGALVLTCGVDVQANRLEYEIVGWGLDDRSWSIEYGILRGDPGKAELWGRLDTVLSARYRHSSGAQMRIASAFVDSGFHTKQVYAFCRPRQIRRVYASKGIGGPGVPLIKPRPQARVHRGRVDLRLVGIDTAKEALYGNLKVEDSGDASYCFFPDGYRDDKGQVQLLANYDEEYFAQLTAEQLVSEMEGMEPVRKWVKKRERNEALDCRVYAMAAVEDLNVDWKALAKAIGRERRAPQIEVTVQEEAASAAQAPPSPLLKSGKKKRKTMKMPGYVWVHR